MTTKRTTRGKATAPAAAPAEQDAEFYRVELSGRFRRRGTLYLPGNAILVSAALYREMKEAGVIANGKPA